MIYRSAIPRSSSITALDCDVCAPATRERAGSPLAKSETARRREMPGYQPETATRSTPHDAHHGQHDVGNHAKATSRIAHEGPLNSECISLQKPIQSNPVAICQQNTQLLGFDEMIVCGSPKHLMRVCQFVFVGMRRSASHKITSEVGTPSIAANCICVRPFSFRLTMIAFPIVFTLVGKLFLGLRMTGM